MAVFLPGRVRRRGPPLPPKACPGAAGWKSTPWPKSARQGSAAMSEALHRATQMVTEAGLPRMVLDRHELPPTLRDFLPVRTGILDNATMAQQGFPGSSAER